jgi:hypothetical protein
VPCAFGLLVDKKAATYKQIFTELKSIAARKGIIFSPSLIMTDFEPGVISAIKTEVSISYLNYETIFFPFFICLFFSFHHLGIYAVFFIIVKLSTDRYNNLDYNSNIQLMRRYVFYAVS